MNPDYEALYAQYGERLIALAFNVAAAAAILIIGLWAAAWAGGAVRRLSKRSHRIDETLAAFFSWIVRSGLTAIVLIAVLRRFGFETTSIVAVFGAAALAIGLALQGTLSNVAAGVMLILFRPYRLGDQVELNGRAGIVHDINLFVTELVAADQTRIVLPNGQCWGAPILNHTAFALKRIDVDFTAPLAVPAEDAIGAAEAALAAESHIVREPASQVLVKSIEHDRTIYTAQAWCPAHQQGAARAALLHAIRLGLEARTKARKEREAAEEEARLRLLDQAG